MTFEKVLDELKTLKDVRPEICEKIKSHNLPVIIFGATQTAARVTKTLKNYGVEIFGYAVNNKYYTPNKFFLERPIYNFDEISKHPDEYVFVLGFVGIGDEPPKIIEFIQDTKIIKYAFNTGTMAQNVNYEYIFANREKFAETFYWLADELSKKTLENFLRLKITYDMKCNFEIYHNHQYFNELTNGVLTPFTGGGGTWIAVPSMEILLKSLLIGAAATTVKFLQLRQIP